MTLLQVGNTCPLVGNMNLPLWPLRQLPAVPQPSPDLTGAVNQVGAVQVDMEASQQLSQPL